MKYVFTITLSSIRGIETQDVKFVGLPEREYEFVPINCVPNDSKVIAVSANHGNVIWYEESHIHPDHCCSASEPIVYIPPTPTPTPTWAPLPPRAPYDLSIARGSIVFAWFHNNAHPQRAEYFDIYRSYDGIHYDHVKTIYARGNGIRVYNIIDEAYSCGGTLYYKVAARNAAGAVYSDPWLAAHGPWRPNDWSVYLPILCLLRSCVFVGG